MRFENSLKELQKAIKDLEKANKKKRSGAVANQIDMFAPTPTPTQAVSNDIDVKKLKKQLDEAISSVETLIKESA